MFNESQSVLEQEDEEKGGIQAEKYVAEFLECHETLFEKVELTEKGGVNDRNQIDAFVVLKDGKRGLPCALDFTGAGKEKTSEKYKRQNIIPFVSRRDEYTKKAVSDPMPHFIIDGLNLQKLIEWGQEADQQGIPITDIMDEQSPKNGPDIKEKFYKLILAKMWKQGEKIFRGSKEEKKMIMPYKELLEKEMENYFTNDELEALSSKVAA